MAFAAFSKALDLAQSDSNEEKEKRLRVHRIAWLYGSKCLTQPQTK